MEGVLLKPLSEFNQNRKEMFQMMVLKDLKSQPTILNFAACWLFD